MTTSLSPPSFNLLFEPWLDVEPAGGPVRREGVIEVLRESPALAGLAEPSPLFAVALHRFLVAVAQDALEVLDLSGIRALLRAGRWPEDRLDAFAAQWEARFDLFSAERPFLQSSDIPMAPVPGLPVKPVGYLSPELPCATAINHFRHIYDENQRLCPACVAKGLLTIPPFATSGGAGIRPSINGVPPLYVLPLGRSLFETLALSLVARDYRPKVAAGTDLPWWRRETSIVQRSKERLDVGYLDSLTFPARRVRLFPDIREAACIRCGMVTPLGVREMVFEMGESRPKDAAHWQDPFAAYRLPKGDKMPVPIRPAEGKATWREFGALFLKPDPARANATIPPGVVSQCDQLMLDGGLDAGVALGFHCAGLRTDMKMKIFEWTESHFEVPLRLLDDIEGQAVIRMALSYAEDVAGEMRKAFGSLDKRRRSARLRTRMLDAFWLRLAEPFRQAVPLLSDPERRLPCIEGWVATVERAARDELAAAADAAGDRAGQLRRRAESLVDLGRRLATLRKKYGIT